MSLIGVRELREQAGEVIRQVRQEQARYVVTYRGRPVAIILPWGAKPLEQEMVRAGTKAGFDGWERFERLAQELGNMQVADMPTQAIMDAIRR